MATRADGIAYSRVPGFDQDLFRCTAWRSTLSVPACGKRWKEAQSAKLERGEELRLCRDCHLGAAHAGEKFIHRAENYQGNVCPRCRRGTMRRLIGQRTCITCYNRENEWRVGKNAKGSAPLKAIAALAVRTIGIVLDVGEATERAVRFSEVAIDTRELEILVGRVHEGKVRFIDPLDHFAEWRPKALGKSNVKKAPIPKKAKADRPQVTPPRRAPISPLRRAALSGSCFSGALERVVQRMPAPSAGSPLRIGPVPRRAA
jgi:hypothetical protein